MSTTVNWTLLIKHEKFNLKKLNIWGIHMIWSDIPRRHITTSWPSFLSFKLLKILYFFYLVSTPCQTALIGNLLSNFCNETWKVIVICDEIWSTDNLTIWSTENCCQALVPSPVPLDPNPNPSPIGTGVTLKTHEPHPLTFKGSD